MVAAALAAAFEREYTLQEEPLRTLGLAPLPRQGIWKRLDIAPSGVDRTVVEALHRTNIGGDNDARSILMVAGAFDF